MKTKEILLSKTGHMHQLCRAERVVLNYGKAAGLRAIEIDNGSGLFFRILEDKALDIANLSYKGMNLAFLAKPGITNPDVCTPYDKEFLRTFQGGFLYTCGLLNVGPPSQDETGYYPFHGRIGNTPADNVCVNEYWEDEDYLIEVSGVLREAALFGENIVQKRSITTKLSSNSFKITDTIENQGFSDEQIMFMYHMNMGYPMLDENARLYLRAAKTTTRDGEDIKEGVNWNIFDAPVPGKPEDVFYHELNGNDDNMACAALYNDYLELGLIIEFDLRQLPCFTQWKSMRSGDYALGLEPGNCHPDGREKSRIKGESEILKAGQSITKTIDVSFYDKMVDFCKVLSKYGLKI